MGPTGFGFGILARNQSSRIESRRMPQTLSSFFSEARLKPLSLFSDYSVLNLFEKATYKKPIPGIMKNTESMKTVVRRP